MNKQKLTNKWQKFIFALLGILYGSGLIYIFFFARRRWRELPFRKINLVPFRDKVEYVNSHDTLTSPEKWGFYKDLIGNVLLFIPFPFLLFFFFGVRRYRNLLFVSMGTSLAIEVVQFILNIGVADIDDLILNSIGAFIGVLIMYGISRFIVNRQFRWILARDYIVEF